MVVSFGLDHSLGFRTHRPDVDIVRHHSDNSSEEVDEDSKGQILSDDGIAASWDDGLKVNQE